jgi:hypothetical protein
MPLTADYSITYILDSGYSLRNTIDGDHYEKHIRYFAAAGSLGGTED